MDEILRSVLLLNNAGADVRLWNKCKKHGIDPSFLRREDTERLTAAGISFNMQLKLGEMSASLWAEREYEECMRRNVRLITCESCDYPASLNDLKDPPLVLYCRGTAEKIPDGAIGVVGTRRATQYGRHTANAIGENCARYNIGVISGGASGIDGCAHNGACLAGGVTFAVLGTGIDVVYPSAHKTLFEDICAKGALISEFPLGSTGEPWHFPRRNRIVAALSEKLIVAEAPLKSGAMITARLALELGREVWAVPGRIDEEQAKGSNRLIFDGAYPFIDMDLFFGVHSDQNSLFTGSGANSGALRNGDFLPEEAFVLAYLLQNSGKTVDNIALEVKMSAAEVSKIIMILSAKGIIFSSGPGRYSAKV